jgi:hypothetical protein
MCNLPAELQRAKLRTLCNAIGERFGTAPTTYKAGRYGLGVSTLPILEELGFRVDVSVCPRYSFAREDGPSFEAFDAQPFFLTPRLLEIPCTVDFVGWTGAARPVVHRLAAHPSLAPLRAIGILRRLGAVNRIMLSPEGNTFDDMRALTDDLLARGVRTFTLSFHSPSLDVGHTPYVRSTSELDQFLDTIERYCDYFMGDCQGVASTPEAFLNDITGMECSS